MRFAFEKKIKARVLQRSSFLEIFERAPGSKPFQCEAEVANLAQEFARRDGPLDHRSGKLKKDRKFWTPSEDFAHPTENQRFAAFRVNLHHINRVMNNFIKWPGLNDRTLFRQWRRFGLSKWSKEAGFTDEFFLAMQRQSLAYIERRLRIGFYKCGQAVNLDIFGQNLEGARIRLKSVNASVGHGAAVPAHVAGGEQSVIAIIGADVDDGESRSQARNKLFSDGLLPVSVGHEMRHHAHVGSFEIHEESAQNLGEN